MDMREACLYAEKIGGRSPNGSPEHVYGIRWAVNALLSHDYVDDAIFLAFDSFSTAVEEKNRAAIAKYGVIVARSVEGRCPEKALKIYRKLLKTPLLLTNAELSDVEAGMINTLVALEKMPDDGVLIEHCVETPLATAIILGRIAAIDPECTELIDTAIGLLDDSVLSLEIGRHLNRLR